MGLQTVLLAGRQSHGCQDHVPLHHLVPRWAQAGWEKTLDELDKKVTSFIWKGTLSKVARATLLLPKEKGGLGLWSPKAKNNAFRSSWILKLNLGKLNPYLESTLLIAAERVLFLTCVCNTS